MVTDTEGTVTGWPLDEVGDGSAPPAGRWRSEKGEKSYEYELVWI